MSFFRKLADHARRSNQEWINSGSSGGTSYSTGSSSCGKSKCCANCLYFEEYLAPGANLRYRCRQHGFNYNPSDVYSNKIHYKKTCQYFTYK